MFIKGERYFYYTQLLMSYLYFVICKSTGLTFPEGT